jgi:hypothetical protein
METVKVAFDVPAALVIAFGDRAMLKSCAASIVRVSALECDSVPELPVAVTV